MTTPCPMTALPAQAADFDGAVGLATIETPGSNPLGGRLMFLHHFDDSWDADPAPPNPGGNTVRQAGPNDDSLQTLLDTSVWPETAGVEPVTFYPDGIHEQRARCPAYQARTNFPVSYPPTPFPSNHGAISYWIKSIQNYLPIRLSFSCLSGTIHASQFLMLGREGEIWGFFVENTPFYYRQRIYERRFAPAAIPVLLPGARWQLTAAHLDTDETTIGQDSFLTLRGIRGQGMPDPIGGYNTPFTSSQGADCFKTTEVFVLGGQDNLKFSDGKAGNQVVDEFAIADFTDTATSAIGKLDGWANVRYQDGRYYKENDGAFLSSVLEPVPGVPVRLLGASWTGYLPKEKRQEIMVTFATIAAIPSQGDDRALDSTLDGACLQVTLMEQDGITPARPLSQGGPVGLSRQRFRYRVDFRPTPTWTAPQRDNQGVMESPWFDDITFTCQWASGPRILAWERP
jgi:hypothetical protein